MDNQGIEIGRLAPMRVAALSVNSRSPEGEAIGGLLDWAKARGISPNRVFGYDSCQPYPDHVYTAWIVVESGVEGDEKVSIADYPGGRCASLTVSGAENIHAGWQRLSDWCRENGYDFGKHQSLEELLNPPDTPPDKLRVRLHLALAD